MPFSDAIETVVHELPLFESVSDRDSFLKKGMGTVRDALGADMSAIFLYDTAAGDLAFRAGVDPEGLWDRTTCPRLSEDPDSFRFSLDGNDVGRAFTEGQVVRLRYDEDEADHPFRSKIIVPITRGPVRTGVLILGGTDPDAFAGIDDGAVLSAITHLADLLVDASALIEGSARSAGKEKGRLIHGRKAGDGIAVGTALPFWADLDTAAVSVMPGGSLEEELSRFDQALVQSISALEDIRIRAEEGISETGALIFLAQVLMLRDSSFTGAMRDLIKEGTTAAAAIRQVTDEYAARFSAMTETRLSEKSQDVRDLGYRLTTALGSADARGFSHAGKIALARHIYPSDLFRLALEGVSGVVLMGGAVTAHISILARSLGLPVLITDDKSLLDIAEGTPLALDTDAGVLVIDPTEAEQAEYRERSGSGTTEPTAFTLRGHSADGTAVSVMANVNILKDAEDARTQGAEGIGLYRSEFPFILRNDILSEEQQYRVYRSIAETQEGKPLVFRTADIGGDKILQGREEPEENPFLGVRGIRFSLAHPGMFRDQLKAMLRAGVESDLGIMLPMVSGVEEVLEARAILEDCTKTLRLRGVPFNENPRIGAMVELPSAALAVKELAEETDFISIGTNDLTMYLLAVDRTNENLSHLYRSHHPTVLRTLAAIVRDAREACPDISVCGDAAADPVLTPFFMGIGIRKLSVSPAAVEPLKRRLADWSVKDAEAVAAEMLAIGRVKEMDAYLRDFRTGSRVPQTLHQLQGKPLTGQS